MEMNEGFDSASFTLMSPSVSDSNCHKRVQVDENLVKGVDCG